MSPATLCSQQILFIMDDPAKMVPKKDTTFALMLEAKRRDIIIYYCLMADLFYRDGKVQALAKCVIPRDQATDFISVKDETVLNLQEMSWIFMRQDPPVDEHYIVTTQLLDRLVATGVRVINEPRAVRDYNEKIIITEFPEFTPPTLIAANPAILRDFIVEHHDVVVKPLNGMGGLSVYRLQPQDANINVILATLTQNGQCAIMAQRYLPAVSEGDKRIFIIDGEVFPYALLRVPQSGEWRANLAQGGRGVGVTLTERDREIAETVGRTLKNKGLFIIGIDVIGECLTEINITSPTCAREIEAHFGASVSRLIFDRLGAKETDQHDA